MKNNSVSIVMDGDIGRLDAPAERVLREVTGQHARFAKAKGMDHGSAPAKVVEHISLMTQMRRKENRAKVKVAVSSVRPNGDQARAGKEYRHSTNGREPILHGRNLQDL